VTLTYDLQINKVFLKNVKIHGKICKISASQAQWFMSLKKIGDNAENNTAVAFASSKFLTSQRRLEFSGERASKKCVAVKQF